MIQKNFWNTVVNSWIVIQTEEDKEQVAFFADKLFERLNKDNGQKKIKSIYEELFDEGEE